MNRNRREPDTFHKQSLNAYHKLRDNLKFDCAQTFLEIARVTAPDDMQGESLLPLLRGNSRAWESDSVYYHYYEYPGEHAVKRHFGIATMDYKLIHFYHDVDVWELYDQQADPQEMNNVYDDPEYAQVREEMTRKLKEVREKYKDSEELDIISYRSIRIGVRDPSKEIYLKQDGPWVSISLGAFRFFNFLLLFHDTAFSFLMGWVCQRFNG